MINAYMKKATVVIMGLCLSTLFCSGSYAGAAGTLTKETSNAALDSLYGKVAREFDRTPENLNLHAINIAEGTCGASLTCPDGTTLSCTITAPLAICGTGPDGGGCFKATVYGPGQVGLEGKILSCD